MRKFNNNFALSPLLKNTLRLSSASIITYSLPLIITPILSRLYTPSDYGEWSVFSSYITILGVMVTGGYEYAIIKSKKNVDIYNLIAVCLVFSLITIFFLSLLLVFSKIFDWSYINNLPAKWFVIIYLFLTAIQGILINFANRKEKYNSIAVGDVSSGFAQGSLRIVFALLPIKLNGLIFGTLVARVYECLYYLLKLKDNFFRYFFKSLSIKRMKTLAIEYKKFPLYDAPSSLLTFASFNLPVLILAAVFSKADVGCYSMVLQILLLPMSFIGSAMGKVYYRQISFLKDETELQTISKSVLKISTIIAFFPIVFFTFGGDFILHLFLGKQWHLAGVLALCLSLWSFPSIILYPLFPVYRHQNKQNRLFRFNLVFTLLTIIALILGIKVWHNVIQTIVIYSVIGFLIRIIQIKDVLSLCKIEFTSINKSVIIISVGVLLLWGIRVYFLT